MVKCEICCETSDTFTCTKCEKTFCFTHLQTHRDQFIQELCQIQDGVNDIRQRIHLEKQNLFNHRLINVINQWEKDSMRTIQIMAEQARQSLIIRANEYISDLTKKLDDLSVQVQNFSAKTTCDQARMTNWNKTLTRINANINPFATMEIDENPDLPVREIKISLSLGDMKWLSNGVSIAGNRGTGDQCDQFAGPWNFLIDENQMMLIADSRNDRVMLWQIGANFGRVVAGGNGNGNGLNQLSAPSDVIIHKQSKSLLICDTKNRRIMQWPHYDADANVVRTGKILLDNIDCTKITVDDQGDFYVSDCQQHCVKRYRFGEKNGIIVAGGNGKGQYLDQLNDPNHIFVDQMNSVYVSDFKNHRVMKWTRGATQGIIVAGGQGLGNNLSQLNHPKGLWIDAKDHVYVADCLNNRVVRWSRDAKEGTLIVGGNEQGSASNQFYYPQNISFDSMARLYVVDWGNERIQQFSPAMFED